uniref:Poly [ADP-ribose] polymerase n=1 Tax=Xenopus tropicalis TaxID=8364 RepID=A0A803JEU7_XENTR
MGDPYLYPVALKWDLGPEKLKELKNKLLVYFQSKSKSNGGECVIRDPDCTPGYVLIHFSQETVRDNVLLKPTHELNLGRGPTVKLNVTLPTGESPTEVLRSPFKETPTKETPTKEPKAKVTPAQEPSSIASPAKKPLDDSTDTDTAQDPGSPAAGGPSQEADNMEPVSSSMVLIGNVQETCPGEMLTLLVEKVSGNAEIQHLEIIPEIHSAVITFTCPADASSFIQGFSSSPRAKQMKLTAKPLEETKRVLVEGLPPNTSEDHLIIYFESPRHGGGSVEAVQPIPGEDAAIVTFCDANDAKRVLGKQHVFGKSPISVYPYYESLGITLYGEKGPCVTLPEPLEVPVSPYVLEFILGDPQIKGDIDKKMADKNCEITWPDPNCPNPTIKLSIPSSISSHLRTMAKIVRTWRDQVSTEFSLIISKFKVAEYDVIPPVWEAIKGEASSSSYGGVVVKPDLAKHKVFLAGLSKVMTKVEETFKDLVENSTRRIDRQNRSMEMSEPLAPALYEIMCKTGQMETIQSQSTELRIEYDVPTRNLKLYGVKEEVLSAKCEIQRVTKQLNSKPLPLDPHIIHFLGFTDNDELSCLLLTRHNINAMFQTEGKSVTLTGLSMKDLSEAEAQMGRELVCKQLTVEDKMIIKGPEWRSLHTHLCKLFNSEKCTVVIEEFPRGAENQVVIAGLAPSVGKASQQIHDFLERNTPIQKDIPVTSVAVIQYIMQEKKQLYEEIKRKNVNVVMKEKTITLSGSRLYVQEAAALIEKVLSSLHTNVLRIKKPGAKKFWMEKEEMYLSTVKNKFRCVVYFKKEGEDEFTENETEQSNPECQVDLPQGVTIAVYKDDLTRHRVDVVVNAAREDLKLTEGLALALLNAAGPKLQTECDRIIKREGKYSVGESVITGAGNLPCKQVIHTVSPKWDPNSQTRCTRLLRRGISRCLELAAENGLGSIGIPAVGSQMSGFPVTVSVQSIVESVRQYVESPERSRKVTRIHLVDSADGTVAAFAEAVRAEFGDYVPVTSPTDNPNKAKDPPRSSDGQVAKTKEGLNITMSKANIQDATTDVIVNSVGKDLNLNLGAVSKALNAKAGAKLQEQLREISRGTEVEEGSVFVTDGFGLNCKKVIHVVTPGWDQGKGPAEKILKDIVKKCLSTTEKEKLRSMTFPAIGTGALGFPKDLVASLMFERILKFSRKSKCHIEVTFVLHPTDTDTIKAFSDELTRRTEASDSNHQSKEGKAMFGSVTSPTPGVHEMRIGSITYQLKTGDITQEPTDVIVNSSDKSFTLKTGVSRAILEAAGKSVEDECAALGAQATKGYITTKGGNLPCSHIIHVHGRTKPDRIKASMLEVLQECEKLKAMSVAFPALGTGAEGVAPSAVADAILNALEEFASSKSAQSVQRVKVMVQQEVQGDFYSRMKSKEGSGQPEQYWFIGKIQNIFSYFKKAEPETPDLVILKGNIEPAVFHLCGEDKEQVMKASDWLKDISLKELNETDIADEWIREFEDKERKELTELQKKYPVSISIDSLSSTMKVSGLSRDVLEITKEIQEIIKEVNYRKTREREAELYSNLVEWKYHDGSGFVPFDKMSNLDLEKAQNEGRQSLTVDVGGVKYTVNMERKSAFDPKGKKVEIERQPKTALPGHWDPMGKDYVKTVLLDSGTEEFVAVKGMFNKTCQMNICNVRKSAVTRKQVSQRLLSPHCYYRHHLSLLYLLSHSPSPFPEAIIPPLLL